MIENKVVFKSISGLSRNVSRSRATIKMKIGEIEDDIEVHVVRKNSFDYDLLIGLDAIKKFKLIQDEELRLWQRANDGEVRPIERSDGGEEKVHTVNFNEYINVDQFEANLDHLPDEQKKRVLELIKNNESIFARNKYDTGCVREHEAHIKLIDKNKFPAKKPYRTSEDERIRIVNLVRLEQILKDQSSIRDEIAKAKGITEEKGIRFKVLRGRKRIYVSRKFGMNVIDQLHHLYGHIGVGHLTRKIRPFYYFKNLDKLIERFCRSCSTCARNKTRRPRTYGLLSRLGPAVRPLQIISIDSIGGFGGNGSPKRYIHLAVDHFTRHGWLLTSSRQTAREFIRLLDPIVKTGEVEVVLSDQYTGNNSTRLKKYLNTANVQLVFTAVDCASSNGLNERLNQTLVNRIRCRMNENQNKRPAWPKVAERCLNEYNQTPHSVTGFSPAYLMRGERSEIIPEELQRETNLDADRQTAFRNSLRDHQRNKSRVDRQRREKSFKEGDLVYIHNGSKLNRGKLGEVRLGPFRVTERISNSMYRVACGKRKSESNVFHAIKLMPFSKV